VDRICISTAKDDITANLNLTDKQFGWILGAFSLGYALFQVPTGWLADKFGPRKLLSGVIVLWSIFTGLTGSAYGYLSMLIYRFLFGAGEAGAFPAIARGVYTWIPMKERGIVNGINFSGSRIGGAAALAFMPWMLDSLGWRNSFHFLAMVGFVFALFFYLWFRDTPEEKKSISKQELDYILETRQKRDAKGKVSSLSGGVIFGSKNVWMTMVQYFASNFTFYFCLSWAYPYLKSKFVDLEPWQVGLLAAIPFVGGAIGNWFGGGLLDRIYKKGEWKRSRQVPAIIGFLLATVGISIFVFIQNPYLAIIPLTIAVFGADMTLSPSWSFCIDIGREHAGVVSGTMNMAGNVGGFLTMLAFPYMTAWAGGRAEPYFILAAVLNIIAVFMWMKMNPSEKLLDD
jgi:ACS family glucarate transporter-like MFS transporter